MKYLFIGLLFLSIISHAQYNYGNDLFIWGKTGVVANDTSTIKYDTIPVIMVVSDTSHSGVVYVKTSPCKGDTNLLCGEEVKEDLGRKEFGYIIYVWGYSVRSKHCCIDGNTSSNLVYRPIPYYQHLFFLDDQKRKLKPEMVVWYSKELK